MFNPAWKTDIKTRPCLWHFSAFYFKKLIRYSQFCQLNEIYFAATFWENYRKSKRQFDKTKTKEISRHVTNLWKYVNSRCFPQNKWTKRLTLLDSSKQLKASLEILLETKICLPQHVFVKQNWGWDWEINIKKKCLKQH